MNCAEWRSALVAGVQSKSPTLACKCIFKPWHTALMFVSFCPPPKGEVGGGILFCQHYIQGAIPPSAKGSSGIKGNLCRASSALNLKGAIWSCQLLVSLERQRRQRSPSPSTVGFQRPVCFSSLRSEVEIPWEFPAWWVDGRCALGIGALSSPWSNCSERPGSLFCSVPMGERNWDETAAASSYQL